MTTDERYTLHVRYRKAQHDIILPIADPSCEQLAAAITSATTADQETIKLSTPGKAGALISLQAHLRDSVSQVGLRPGTSVVMYASTQAEVQHVRASKDLPGMAGFQQELKQHMRRQRGSSANTLTLPSGPYTFQGYEAWQQPHLAPLPPEALKLLHRLAADPGIAGIMSKHHWSVGLLSEMPPEGKVGVSPVCILGVNINRGQEISLRLRTDDLKGFRRYDRIRETLCHELAHMVWGEHDNRFKQLNSQLLKECGQLDWTGHAGHALQAFEDPSAATWIDEDDVMVVTAQASGQTLRQLTQGQGLPSEPSGSPRRAAAMAASARLAALVNPNASAFPQDVLETAHRAALVSSPPEQQHSSPQPEADVSDAVPGQKVAVDPAADIAKLGHRDASTEQAEEAMRQLGSMDFASEVQHMSSPELAAAQQREHAQAGNDQRGPIPDSAADLVQQRGMSQTAEVNGTQLHNQDAVQHALVTQPTSPANNQIPAYSAGTISPAAHSLSSEQSTQGDQETQTQAGSTTDMFGSEAGPKQTDSGDITHAPLGEPAQAAAPMEVDADDPAVQRYRKAEAAVAHLRFEAGAANQLAALETLLKILQNIVSHPGESKYSQIRLGNPAFHSRAGQFAAARELLAVAGFTEEAAGAVDKVLVWKRHDQGLLWLALSAVQNGIQQVS